MSWSTSVVSPPDGDMAAYMASLARLAARENRADVVNGVSRADTSDAVSAILVDLSQREAQAQSDAFAALVLRELEGKSYEEIAEITHTNLGTVKSRLNRARTSFADLIEPKLR